MLRVAQLRTYVVRPALVTLGMWSEAAEALVTGTAAAESGLEALVQSGGPALGFWQIEPATHADCWSNYLGYRPELAGRVMLAAGRDAQTPPKPPDDWLIFNLRYAAAICRIKYARDSAPLPAADDLEGLARYWLRVYNAGGKGSIGHFVDAYGLVEGAAWV